MGANNSIESNDVKLSLQIYDFTMTPGIIQYTLIQAGTEQEYRTFFTNVLPKAFNFTATC